MRGIIFSHRPLLLVSSLSLVSVSEIHFQLCFVNSYFISINPLVLNNSQLRLLVLLEVGLILSIILLVSVLEPFLYE